jgi:hypothetical protein
VAHFSRLPQRLPLSASQIHTQSLVQYLSKASMPSANTSSACGSAHWQWRQVRSMACAAPPWALYRRQQSPHLLTTLLMSASSSVGSNVKNDRATDGTGAASILHTMQASGLQCDVLRVFVGLLHETADPARFVVSTAYSRAHVVDFSEMHRCAAYLSQQHTLIGFKLVCTTTGRIAFLADVSAEGDGSRFLRRHEERSNCCPHARRAASLRACAVWRW